MRLSDSETSQSSSPGSRLINPLPTQFGKYRVLEQLGSGAFGTVYRCHDETLDRIVSVKVLHTALHDTSETALRFQREARTAAKLSHPHIVSVYDAGFDNGRLFLVMELVEGHSLDRLIGTPRLTVETTLRVIFHLAQALQAAHENGIIHRDVKSANVLIDAAGRPKLTDFGLARVDDSPAMSRSGDLIGTPRYMSPEQALLPSNEVDHRTDLYSLGAVMYEMLTGRPVADGPTALAVLRKVTDEPIVPVTALAPAVPVEVAAICQKLLAKKRDDRYATAEEVAKAIQDYIVARLFGQPEVELLAGLPALPAAPIRRPAPRWSWWLASAAFLVLICWVVVSFRTVPPTENLAPPALDPARVAAEAEAELSKLASLTDDRGYRTALSDLLDGLNTAVKQHPTNAELRAVRGRVLRRAGEFLAAIADLETSTKSKLVLERTLARYQWEIVYLNGYHDASLRPVPSVKLLEELRALASQNEPIARLLTTLGIAVTSRDGAAIERALVTVAASSTDADVAMIEADAFARMAADSHEEIGGAEPEKKPEWRKKRDDFDTRAAQALRRGLSADPHHLGLLFLKAAAWHRRIQWDASDGDDRDQLERRHRPAFESAYQRYRVGCVRLSTEAATGRAILLSGSGRNDQALDALNDAAGRGSLPPSVAALRGWLQLSAPPDWELTPTHAAAIRQQLAPILEQHPEEFTLYLVRAIANLASGGWEDARRDILDGKKVYRGASWPPSGSTWNICRDAVKSPVQFLDVSIDYAWNFPTTNETKLKLSEEFLRRMTAADASGRKGLEVDDVKALVGWGHFRHAKFHAEKDNRVEVLKHVRAALSMKLADLGVPQCRTDGNLKAWNDDPEFQKLYAEFEKK